jgi:cytochrome c-type biogenesis protein CcmH/NrfG
MGDREGAVEILQVATTLDSKPITALYYLGYMLKAMGRFGEATVAFEKLLEIEPDYPMIKGALQEMHQPSGVSASSLH